MPLQSQTPGKQPRRVLLHSDQHLVQPGGVQTGVHRRSERAADLPVPTQEEHGAAGAPHPAQGEEETDRGSLGPARSLPQTGGGGLRLSGCGGAGRRRRGGGDRDGDGGR